MANLFFNNNIIDNNNVANTYQQLNNIINTNLSSDNPQSILSKLQDMMLGEIFTGEIQSFSNDKVTINLGSGNILNANINSDTINFSKGDMVTFVVENNDPKQITIKPLDQSGEVSNMASKALDAAGLSMTKETLSMVKNLIDNNMPIDKNTLNSMSKIITKYPDAPINDLVRMTKLNIPVTRENIIQYEAYKNFENSIAKDVNSISDNIVDLIKEFPKESTGLISFIDDIADLVMDNKDTYQLPNKESLIPEKTPENIAVKEAVEFIKSELININDSSVNNSVKPNYIQLIDKYMSDNGINGNTFKFQIINNLLKESIFSNNISEDLLKAYKEVLADSINDQFFLSPEKVSEKEAVKEIYNKLIEFTKKAESIVEKNNINHTEFGKNIASVKNSVNFMNDLNQNIMYIQIPIKFSTQTTKGDLYVLNNKKKKYTPDEQLTAFLHLDMNNLGPMDIYIKLKNKNVNTNFCLEKEEMLDFIYEHIDVLTKRLQDKGYNFNPTMTIKNPDSVVDFEKDIIDESMPVIPISRYIFDIKA